MTHGGDFYFELKNKFHTKYKQNPPFRLIVQGRLFCYAHHRKGGDFLTIEEYIKSKEKFRMMPFVTIYTAIMELINDGYIRHDVRGMRDGYSRDDGKSVHDGSARGHDGRR